MRLIDADALMEKSFEIEYADGWHKNITKEVVSIRDINNTPTIDPNELELDIDYSIEYDKRPDGISNAKVTITRITPRNIIACEEVDELDMLERMYSEPSGDLISREEAIDVGNKIVEELSLSSIDWDDLKYWAKELFDALPSADRPKGEWIFNPTDAIDLMFAKPKCSKCGFESSDGGNYCSNCGADMRGEK